MSQSRLYSIIRLVGSKQVSQLYYSITRKNEGVHFLQNYLQPSTEEDLFFSIHHEQKGNNSSLHMDSANQQPVTITIVFGKKSDPKPRILKLYSSGGERGPMKITVDIKSPKGHRGVVYLERLNREKEPWEWEQVKSDCIVASFRLAKSRADDWQSSASWVHRER